MSVLEKNKDPKSMTSTSTLRTKGEKSKKKKLRVSERMEIINTGVEINETEKE